MNRQLFFSLVRGSLFGGTLDQGQVDGMDAIMDEWDREKLTDIRWLAYMLATVLHECAKKMQPIREYGGTAYFNKRYGPATKVGKMLGNTQEGDGARFAGRGFVQLTGRANYVKASNELGVDFVANPERTLELPLASQIMFRGMQEGWFTGRKLSQYFHDGVADAYNARRIINGLDKAQTIAGYYNKFYDALLKAKGG